MSEHRESSRDWLAHMPTVQQLLRLFPISLWTLLVFAAGFALAVWCGCRVP